MTLSMRVRMMHRLSRLVVTADTVATADTADTVDTVDTTHKMLPRPWEGNNLVFTIY